MSLQFIKPQVAGSIVFEHRIAGFKYGGYLSCMSLYEYPFGIAAEFLPHLGFQGVASMALKVLKHEETITRDNVFVKI